MRRRQQARRQGAWLLAHFLLYIIIIIFVSSLPGAFSSQIVTLDSIELFTSHEWLDNKPIVYFRCQDEKDTVLPDVKKTNVVYAFKDAESWQPLTELSGNKCKRCGFYEKDTLKSDDVFDEWELCPDDFVGSDGKYVHFKEKEFNATFSCPECKTLHTKSKDDSGGRGMHIALAIVVSALVSVVTVAGIVVGYKYWQKRKREHDQARFLKLFEEGDDIEDELGLGM